MDPCSGGEGGVDPVKGREGWTQRRGGRSRPRGGVGEVGL